jgi:putative oxidoreductase
MSGPLAAVHLPAFIAYGVYVGEVVAPVLIVIGLWSRIAALVVALNMVTAIALTVFFLGPGRYALSRGKEKLG